jgi:threonine synthase
MAKLPEFRFVSGKSVHADRLATIRDMWEKHQLMIDTHTADAVKVAREHREPGIPMVVLETAQPVKFAETIQEALGRDPMRPRDFDGIENLPQRVEVMKADAQAVKDFVVRHCA